tara:strand:- start:85057 stop:85452 length:396 start_codon:yes stop_codon:yes gene_type:complete
MNYEELIEAIQSVLTPDLLKKEYRGQDDKHFTYGHCYAACDALYELIGRKESGFTPHCAKDENGITHWWLQRGEEILDPTKEQYTSDGVSPPYSKGKGKGFLTKEPSKRARKIIKRIRDDGNSIQRSDLDQ